MKKGKLAPAARFAQRRRRAARRARGRERQRRNAERRVIEWLRDEPRFSSLGWEMEIYAIEIPVVPEMTTKFGRYRGSLQ